MSALSQRIAPLGEPAPQRPAAVGLERRTAAPTRRPEHRVRVALLDDHELLLDSLSSWIRDNAPEFHVAVTATSWTGLVQSPAFPTDLVLMDMQISQPISIEARVRTCRAAGAKVMIITAHDTEENRARAQRAGAAACLSKARPPRDVMAIARAVVGLGRPSSTGRPQRPGTADLRRPDLSPGELNALMHYVDGLTMDETAAEMGVKYETVKTFLRRVREKYGRVGRPTSSRADLIRRAAEDGYLL